jgi:hypothetical protein
MKKLLRKIARKSSDLLRDENVRKVHIELTRTDKGKWHVFAFPGA